MNISIAISCFSIIFSVFFEKPFFNILRSIVIYNNNILVSNNNMPFPRLELLF